MEMSRPHGAFLEAPVFYDRSYAGLFTPARVALVDLRLRVYIL